MIKKSKQKTYYETELIDTIICDKCGKDLTKENCFYIINVDNVYFDNDRKKLESLDIGYTKHLCNDCGDEIQKILN
jgi:hypothetical protein